MKTIEDFTNPMEFLRSLGNLHDARIDRVEFDSGARAIVLDVRDIYVNFVDNPEYPGALPCSIIFRGVKAFAIDIETQEGVRVSDLEVFKDGVNLRLQVELNLGCGNSDVPSIVISFDTLEIMKSPSLESRLKEAW